MHLTKGNNDYTLQPWAIKEVIMEAIKRIETKYTKEYWNKMNVICFELGLGDGKGNFSL